MNDDDLFAATLHRAVATLEPPVDRLVAGGIARGRRRRRLVLGGEILTGAALTAAVLALIVALMPASTQAKQGANRAGGPSTSPAGSGDVLMTPQALLQTALDTLPRPGRATAYDGTAVDGSVETSFVYDDGHGAAQISVELSYPLPDGSVKQRPPVAPCAPGSSGCTVLSDGQRALISKGHEYGDSRQPNPAKWQVEFVRADGAEVSIVEYNAPRAKAADISRPTPPFSPLELTTWATNAAWQTTISAQRARSAEHLFQPQAAKQPADGSAASEEARIKREAAAQMRKAELARERAACAAAAAAHSAPPAYCAKIK